MTKKTGSILLEPSDRLAYQLEQHRMLLELGRTIVSEMDMDALFKVIMDQTRRFMDTEKCSVFIFDAQNKELWSRVSTDLKTNEIRFPASTGIAGWVFQNQEPLLVNDAYTDPRFYREVDRKTKAKTRNILCLPLCSRPGECIGTVQVINKNSGNFNEDDQELLTSVGHYITIALENARLYEDLKVLDRAKERVINHLSHELKTPLSVLSAALQRIERQVEEARVSGIHKTLVRGKRQVERLMDLEKKIADILDRGKADEPMKMLHVIQDAADLIDVFKNSAPPEKEEIVALMAEQLEALFAPPEFQPETIRLKSFLENILAQAKSAMDPRNLDILLKTETNPEISMDQKVLHKVVSGLLKNAIENTPDQGMIELILKSRKEEIELLIRDRGVGITDANRDQIFGGFFHTQNTDMYSSKRPYEFNAGGAGADLLRIKTFSERFDFQIQFRTERCRYIPEDEDPCPGNISRCAFVNEPKDCFESGGSTFIVRFSRSKPEN